MAGNDGESEGAGTSTNNLKVSGANLTVGGVPLSAIAKNAYEAIGTITNIRSQLMAEITRVACGSGDKMINVNKNASSKALSIDISTGAGALVLDDALQELSTVEQAAAQLVAAENKAQKQVHSVVGQG
ncbi:MAG: hypothetical protein LBJ25_07825 [Candidatus Margulisbacteria bacterium]|jgi:hypothetical protein|nr:hypothetical protein [Candidatus Margulisiibacteriota bacterium]